MELGKDVIDFLVNHVILPPKLPQKSEGEDAERQGEMTLLRFVIDTIISFSKQCDGPIQEAWRSAKSALENLDKTSTGSTLSKESLEWALSTLKQSEALALHVKAQNVGLLIHRNSKDQIIFDAFEASADSQSVMQTKGRLVWQFPGCSVVAPCEKIQDARFVTELAAEIHRLHSEKVPQMQPTSRKAKELVEESRDTSHPGLVTEKLMISLTAYGDNFNGPKLCKHVRDEVNWNEAAIPWRRSPFWLVIRVCLSLVLKYSLNQETANRQYKNMMAYLIARISCVVQADITPDVAAIINMKAARKLSKMGANALDFVVSAVTSAVTESRGSLEESWLQIQANERYHIGKLPKNATETDSYLRLTKSGPYILEAIANCCTETNATDFDPPQSPLLQFESKGLPILIGIPLEHRSFLLEDFEHWAFENLWAWKQGRPVCENHCVSLKALLTQYMNLAMPSYSGNSRATSIMLLAVLHIWTVLDSICIELQPMMKEYSPEIPQQILEPLLLPQLYHMKKLASIEAYLENRYRVANLTECRILQDPTPHSFSVRYFDKSSSLQDLRAKIESEAQERRDKKIEEWREKTSKFEALKREAASLPHYCQDEEATFRQVCRKCEVEGQAKAFKIHIDEWALPQNECQLKAVVFELDCPVEFAMWRDSTYAILQNLGREKVVKEKHPDATVSSYKLLHHHFSNKGQVLTFGSTNKSFLKTHYESYSFPTSLDTVCLSNALNYRLVHPGIPAWVGDQTSVPSFSWLCITKLPQAQYSNLQAFVDTSSSTPNDAIADQSICQSGLSDHEFIAFATLRAGERVQLLNILRELGSADLNFGAEAVLVLIRQATHQAGKRGQHVERVAHEVFKDVSFCNRLLGLLNDHLEAVKGNWEEQHRLTTLSVLGLRVLSLTNNSVIVEQATKLLLSLRRVALTWCRQVSCKLPSCSTEESAKNLRTAVLRMALTCRMTFDVDPRNIPKMLGNEEDVSNLVETSILIQNNWPVALTDLPPEAQHDMLLNQKLSRRLEIHLRKLIAQSSRGINQVIGPICGTFDFNDDWGSHLVSSNSWVVNETTDRVGARRQKIHLNLLDGQLLIDGQPLDRLPSKYIQKPLYRRVFGSRILNVSVSSLPQMQYRSLEGINGHEVHLGLHGKELLIKAVCGSRVLRIIPHEVFDGDIPHRLQHDYVHWLDMENCIEFRPVKTPWTQTLQAIKMEFDPKGQSIIRMGGNSKLIESQSTLGQSICAILEPIERIKDLVITASLEGKIWAELPRFGLKFVINEDGILESKQLSSTVVQDQQIGCMYGLQNKLILEATGSHASLNHKSVLVPFGPVLVSSAGGHRSVRIKTDSAEKLRFFQFSLNTTLGKLQGGSSMTELLFKAYLHATTTFVLPDPLTGHTGTAEALSILQDGRLKTSFAFSEEASNMLLKIADLTPRRDYYPSHLEKMQQVQWQSALDQLAQHEDFYTLALDIIVHNSQFSIVTNLDDFNQHELSRSRGNNFLLERASLRNSSIRHTQLERNLHQDRHNDKVYNSRDHDIKSPRALRVYEITSLILEWPERVQVMENLSHNAEKSWSDVAGYQRDLEADDMTLTKTLELPIERNFGYLYTRCCDCTREADTHKLVFLFATLDFGCVPDPDLRSYYLRTLLGIAFSRRFKTIMPKHEEYSLSNGKAVDRSMLETELENVCRPFRKRKRETQYERQGRCQTYENEKREQIEKVIEFVTHHWPCDAPPVPQNHASHILDIDRAAWVCLKLFREWNKNRQYFLHLNRVDEVLQQISAPPFVAKRPSEFFVLETPLDCQIDKVYSSLTDLLNSKAPPTLAKQPHVFVFSPNLNCAKESCERTELRQILADLKSGGNETRISYVDDLLSSVEALEKAPTQGFPREIEQQLQVLLEHREELSNFVRECLGKFNDTLRPTTASEESVQIAGLWPRITSSALLKCLSPKMANKISWEWIKALRAFGQAISLLQRSERLIGLKMRDNILGFHKEASEPGFQGWTAEEFPDWLMIEIENNLTIRAVQVVVAKQMISPTTCSNSVLQLNMGEGKSSVIIPMAVTALANRRQIARLIVLKSLLKQTHSLLIHRLGGLVDRSVYHTPFSRDTKLCESGVSKLQKIYLGCQDDQGVLLALPEHIFSFRLMGREELQIPKHAQLAKSLISLDTWLGEHCRDILDESDELLDSKFQLVYSMGRQQHMNGQPDRWILISGVFSLVMKSVQQIHRHYLADVQVDYRGRSFPFLYFLQPQACPKFIECIANEVLKGNLIGVSFDHCSPAAHELARRFITKRDLTSDDFSFVQRGFEGTPLWTKLHLLRGLFAHKILDFVLQHKLWLVNYGLALDRCLMAVPYRAKGVPSQKAEFGHPDVGLALTCLSYYYSGLTSRQLRQSFEILMAEPDPDSEYSRWVRDCSCLPSELCSFDGVNLEDLDLWAEKIFPSLRFSKALADFYMARVVFPREAKEFPNKLSLSAWDLPSGNSDMVTTGFSGTNDNKSLLPSSIRQRDLPHLQHTNAGVIDLLLQEENRSYFEAKNEQGRRLGLDEFLRAICGQKRRIRVLIDVGAQILEAINEEVARKWLELSPGCEAAVFFSENDEIMVVERDSRVELLSASPFKRKLDQCIVYLDEVHTRGVDLQFPTDFRAAVTLGTKVTKDRLVQGCMRMRKLGNNQSVVFFAPPEVHLAILSISGKTAAERLDSADVMRWSLQQTCNMTDVMKSLYIIQGLEFAHRSRKCSALTDIGALTTSDIISFNKDIQEPEARTLEEMYGADARKNIIRPCLIDDLALIDPVSQHLIAQWDASDPTANQDFVLQEEQEREISHEVEQELEIQKAAPAKARTHALHPEIVSFVKTGTWQKGMSVSIMPAFQGLKNTSAYKHLAVTSRSHMLYVTRDFVQTVEGSNGSDHDQYIRPVKFVVSSTETTDLLVISPYEANELLPRFRNSTTTRLHLYSAKTSKKMKSFSDLSFYTITGVRPAEPPECPLAIAQLDIFAGSLFLRDYASYLGVCDFLGIVTRRGRSESDSNKDIRIATDGFADHETRVAMNWPVVSPFTTSPLPFLGALMGIRRKGQVYSQTHLGNVTNGRVLTEESFEAV